MKVSAGIFAKSFVVLAVLALGACAGSSQYMRDIAPEEANYAPENDKALVVFMRPSGLGFAVQSTVFDITSGDPVFIGVLSAKAKLAHQANTGQQRFMVLGEQADFMDAMLEQGKVYYTVVSPEMGLWKARFAFEPVHGDNVNSEDFAGWYADTRWVENLDTAEEWARQNMTDIRNKMTEYLPDWEKKSEKPTLGSEDGHQNLYQEAAAN